MRISSAITVALGLFLLVDWFTGAHIQPVLVGSFPRSLPITILLHVVLAVAFFISKPRPRLAKWISVAVSVVALLLLAKNFCGGFFEFDISLSLERRLFEPWVSLPLARHPGLPAIQTCIGLIFCATIILTRDRFGGHSWPFLLHLFAVLFIPYSALCGFAFGATQLYRQPGDTSSLIGISPVTVVFFLLQYVVIFAQSPENMLYRIYFGKERWGKMLRLFQDVAVAFPLVVGYLNRYFFEPRGNTILLAFASAIFPLIIAFFNIFMTKALRNYDNAQQVTIEELEKSLTFQKQLDSLIAHDLRSPFNGILGLTGLMAMPETTEINLRKYASLVNKEAQKFFDLLEDLLRWSQRQKSQRKIEYQYFSSQELYQYLETYFEAELRRKTIDFRATIPESFRIYGDMQMTQSILRNFLSNAIKFSAPGKTIEFRAIKFPYNAILAIGDEGKGFNAEAIQAMLMAGDVKSAPGSMGESGFGLGLSICRDFAALLNGQITVMSKIGHGSELGFLTPLDQRESLREGNHHSGRS